MCICLKRKHRLFCNEFFASKLLWVAERKRVKGGTGHGKRIQVRGTSAWTYRRWLLWKDLGGVSGSKILIRQYCINVDQRKDWLHSWLLLCLTYARLGGEWERLRLNPPTPFHSEGERSGRFRQSERHSGVFKCPGPEWQLLTGCPWHDVSPGKNGGAPCGQLLVTASGWEDICKHRDSTSSIASSNLGSFYEIQW